MKLVTTTGVLVVLMAAGCAMAQSIYRGTDANGKIVFSDRPFLSNDVTLDVAQRTAAGVRSGDNGTGVVPYELRQIMDRYPVALYTGDDCAPCKAGRSLLVSRGVPFSERSVTTSDDSEALQRLSGQKSLPLISIGKQQLRGFSNVEWSQYLDAAGYPKNSQLPTGYRNAPAAPLVALSAVAIDNQSDTPTQPMPRALPAVNARTPANPAGIQF